MFGGMCFQPPMIFSAVPSGNGMPLATANDATSRTAACIIGAMSGSSRSSPIGRRVSAVQPLLVASKMYFSHSSVRMRSLSVASKPAFWHSARKASPRGVMLPSNSPNTRRMNSPVWRITPGLSMVALICATPPITASAPRIGSSRSCASMPFWKVITAVSGPTIGLMASPALSTSHSFTQNITRSTTPTLAGSSVAWAGCSSVSPRGLRMRRPFSCIAFRCAPRAMNVTSPPAWASAAPNAPPTPPAPTTAMRMSRSSIWSRA